MTRKEFLKPALWALTGVMAIIILLHGCDYVKSTIKQGQTDHLNTEARWAAKVKEEVANTQALSKRETDSLKNRNAQLEKRKLGILIVHDTIIAEIEQKTPIECDSSIQAMKGIIQSERKLNDTIQSTLKSTIERKDKDIKDLNEVIFANDALINKAANDLKLMQDTLSDMRKPKPLKRIWQTTKNVTIGAAIGAAIVELFNILK